MSFYDRLPRGRAGRTHCGYRWLIDRRLMFALDLISPILICTLPARHRGGHFNRYTRLGWAR